MESNGVRFDQEDGQIWEQKTSHRERNGGKIRKRHEDPRVGKKGRDRKCHDDSFWIFTCDSIGYKKKVTKMAAIVNL